MRRSLLIAVTLALLFPAAAVARDHSVVVTFANLMPGVPGVDTRILTVERESRFAGFDWTSRTGILGSASLRVEICQPDCVDAAAMTGRSLAAGEVVVRVTATLPGDVAAGGTGLATGQIVLRGVGDPDLPFTGFEGLSAAIWAGTLIGGGILIVRATRREGSSE